MDMPTFDRRAYVRAIGLFPERPRIVSEGDSWFSYPLSINLVRRLNLIEPRCNWLRLEHRGDEALDVVQSAAFDDRAATARIGYQERRLAGLLAHPVARPQALLLSAGGNDVIGEGMRDLLVPHAEFLARGGRPQDAIADGLFDATLAKVERAFRRIARLRDAGTPRRARWRTIIVTHAYSPPQPRAVPLRLAMLSIGPWMHGAFEGNGYPDDPGLKGSALMLAVVGEMLARFQAMLQRIVADTSDFHVAPTQGLLAPAVPCDPAIQGDWHDEIHPSDAGNLRLADAFRPILAARFPGYFT